MTNKIAQSAKQDVGAAAAQLVQDGMVVGIGTGTTAAYFIESLIERYRGGLQITAVASSRASGELAARGGISVVDIDTVSKIDIAIDGADEIDPNKCLIKGGGGALLREKIVAINASEMVVMVDETKLVDQLGTFGLPLEVVPFGHTHTLRQLQALGYQGNLRLKRPGQPYVTDNGNYLYDLQFREMIDDPHALDRELKLVTGVIETGLFVGLVKRVLVGYGHGRVELQA